MAANLAMAVQYHCPMRRILGQELGGLRAHLVSLLIAHFPLRR